ncbi:hypothetical protein DIURU_005549 [Diutina rugosa]|uniref:UGGT thioredoxin-like domain-containing protein n=1 Tax=Diutina rugosa TaxID=5481 RepID=A0A642UFA6_DIURU|nr:uncharacterized protein DIURU_005549 [Diutina rugosa]KAA8896809.1 hypothetical protein DIURU_005549 [Diutina rugosa]
MYLIWVWVALVAAAFNVSAPELELVESIAHHNFSLYLPAITELFVEEADLEDIWTELEVDPAQAAEIEADAAEGKFSADIEDAHNRYQSILNEVEWNDDTFGNPIATTNWVWYHGRVLSYDDLFAIKTSAHSESVEEYDRVIGDTGPVMIFYGDYTSDDFPLWLSNLVENANSGKLRFVWRYIV